MSGTEDYARGLAGRHRLGWLFEWICRLATWGSVAMLVILVLAIFTQAWNWLSWDFLSKSNSYKAHDAGIMPGLWGSLWLISLTGLFCVPIGVGAAIYLEEYARPNWLTRQIQLNIANLAGVPSIVYGILGFSVFVRMFGATKQEYLISFGLFDVSLTLPLGRTVLSGALTLTLLSLPVVIIAAQEALRSVPATIRHAAYALGATRWQTIWYQVLPAAMPGILTGLILAMSRAIGETAPLAVLGAATQISFAPGRIMGPLDVFTHPEKLTRAPFDSFTAIPLQIFGWVYDQDRAFQHVAAAGIVVLLVVLVLMNGAAILIRNHFQKNIRW